MSFRRLALLVTLALSATLAPASAAGPGAERQGAAASITVEGRGYGHGHGLSQYGAQRAALQGRTHRQILGFYYPGLDWGRAGGKVSVLISGDRTKDVAVAARPGLTVRQVSGPVRVKVTDVRPQAQRWRIMPLAGGRSGVEFFRSGWRRLTTFPGAAEFSAGGRPVTLFVTNATRVAYRGVLRSVRGDTVNILPLDSYLQGVVPVEVPALWHENAVRAQSVAARTYAAFDRADAPSRHYQICDTSECQVYGGFTAEHPASNAAIRATAGDVLTAGGRPAFTQFSASNGGWTSAGAFSYLPEKQDPYDTWSGNPYNTWSVTIPASQVEAAFPAVGNLTGVEIARYDSHGVRASKVRISGSAGSGVVTGDTFRSIFGLRSTYFRIGLS